MGKKARKPLSVKLKEAFTHDDIDSIGDYVIFQVFLPHILDAIADTIHSATDALFRSDDGYSSSDHRDYTIDKASYNKKKSGHRDYNNCTKVKNVSDLIITRKADATQILAMLRSDIYDYEQATMGAFKEACNEVLDLDLVVDITDHNYGWKNLDNARVQTARGGYIIAMPKPVYLK